MRNAAVICGSAKPDGVTRAMCVSAARCLGRMGFGVDLIVPSELCIRHCTNCGACRAGRCIIDDDMDRVYGPFSSSELVVLASPIHFSGPSSIIKTVMDRFQPYWFDRGLQHPRSSIGLLCGGSERPLFSNTESIFRAFSITTGMEWRGCLNISSTDRNGTEGVDGAVTAFLESVIKGI